MADSSVRPTTGSVDDFLAEHDADGTMGAIDVVLMRVTTSMTYVSAVSLDHDLSEP